MPDGEADIGHAGAIAVVIEHVEIVGEVRDVNVVPSIVVVVADGDAHVGLVAAAAVERRAGLVADVLESAVAEVAVHVVWPGIVGDQQVQTPVVIQIEPGDAESIEAFGVGHTGLSRGVGERAVTIVPEQMIGRAAKAARAAHHRQSAIGAVRCAGRVDRPHASCPWRRSGPGETGSDAAVARVADS